MKTFNVWAFIVALFFTTMSFAQQVDLSKVSDSDKVKILAMKGVAVHEPVVVKAAASAPSTAEVVKEWAAVGQAVGAGVVGAARELGIVANDFAKTDLGKITIAILVYKYMGAQMLDTVGKTVSWITKTLVLVGGFTFGWRLIRRAAYTAEITYIQKPILFGAWTWTKKQIGYVRHKDARDNIRHLTDSEQALYIIGVFVGLFSILFFIFGR